MYLNLIPPPFGRAVASDEVTFSNLTYRLARCGRSSECRVSRLRSKFWPAAMIIALAGWAPSVMFGQHHHGHGSGSSGASDPLSSLVCSSRSLTGAATDTCMVTLNNAAGSGGVTLTLSSSSRALAVPVSVTVPVGEATVVFTATATAVTATQTATLRAADSGGYETFAVQLNGSTPALTPTGVLSAIACGSGSISGAGNDACTVTLTGAAASGGLTVILASNDAALKVPASVTVASGASSAGFTATASAVSTSQTATLTATSASVTKTYAVQLGTASTPGLTIASSSVAFGSVPLKTPATQTLKVASTGTAAVTINAATVQGTGFAMSGMTAPVTLSPGAAASLAVQFDPTVAGTATGTLTITSNSASGATVTIGLSGTGAAAASYQVGLSWDAPASSAVAVSGYHIYRELSGGSYTLLNSSPNAGTTYTDSTVQSGSAYNYEVTSVDASGVESAPSGVYTAAIP